jgi:hypothetical protein
MRLQVSSNYDSGSQPGRGGLRGTAKTLEYLKNTLPLKLKGSVKEA